MATGAVVAHPADKYANATQPWMRYQPRRDTLTAYKPTMAERIPIAVKDGLRALGLNKFAANAFGTPIADVLGYSPVGAVAQSWDGGQAAARADGRLNKALGLGGGMALAALGAVPGGKGLARKGEALAMDEASRMARAREMGFDTSRVWYHGSDANIEAFAPDYLGRNTGAKSAKGGYFFASDPEVASGYAQHTRKQTATEHARYQHGESLRHAAYARLNAIGEVKHERIAAPDGGFYTRIIKPDGLTQEQDAIYSQALSDIERSWEFAQPVGGNVTPVYLRTENPRVHDYKGAEYRNTTYSKQLTAAKRGKRDSVILKNTFDPATIRAGDASNKVTDVASVFDPSQVRSIFAAFDPAKRGSSDLLALTRDHAAKNAGVPLNTRTQRIIDALATSPRMTGGEGATAPVTDAAGRGMFPMLRENKALSGIIAYHGSPHTFDKFSLDKIGTGEGAQAYGHGLYFAENEAVARGYRDALTDQNANYVKQVLDESSGDFDKAIADTRDMIAWKPALSRQYGDAIKILEQMKRTGAAPPTGSMYQVRINADPADFLDWDKPLAEQSDKVRAALMQAGVQGAKLLPPKRVIGGFEVVDASGKPSVYSDKETADKVHGILSEQIGNGYSVVQSMGGGSQATERLSGHGIPGIKYLDAGSRGAGDGSRNYVVFDDKLIDILKRYGWVPGTAIPAGLLANAQLLTGEGIPGAQTQY